ncbi:MAG: hypothetical protein AAB865_00175 [Patescibacteria group bacterium]
MILALALTAIATDTPEKTVNHNPTEGVYVSSTHWPDWPMKTYAAAIAGQLTAAQSLRENACKLLAPEVSPERWRPNSLGYEVRSRHVDAQGQRVEWWTDATHVEWHVLGNSPDAEGQTEYGYARNRCSPTLLTRTWDTLRGEPPEQVICAYTRFAPLDLTTIQVRDVVEEWLEEAIIGKVDLPTEVQAPPVAAYIDISCPTAR